MIIVHCVFAALISADEGGVSFTPSKDEVEISIGKQQVATYVYADPVIPRPYLTQVQALDGYPVTRNHPPVEGKDLMDHETMHPGVWLAFGDLNGADFWRNKARVRAAETPTTETNRDAGVIRVQNLYEADGKAIAKENCQITFQPVKGGYWILWDSMFTGENELVFGDQEEMGFGLRMATPLMVKQGGTMVNSDGLRDEKGVWGKIAAWLDYSRVIDGKKIGILMIPDPDNARPSYFHARDYGMMTANMFGERAFTGKGDGAMRVGVGMPLRLRYGLFVYSGTEGEIGSAQERADDYARLVKKFATVVTP